MSVTREELAAFADGELDPKRHAEVEKALEANPELLREVEAHRALRSRLAAHYTPILDEPVPDRLGGLLKSPGKVVDLAEQRASRSAARARIPRWGWIAAPALAASLVLALLIPRDSAPEGYAGQQIATALEDQLVATQAADSPVRVLLSFRDRSGSYCRAFTTASQGGIACKDAQGWQLRESLDGSADSSSEFRQAGSANDELMALVQKMADGPALDAEQELDAKGRRWGQAQ